MVVDWKIYLMTCWVGLVDGWFLKKLYRYNYTKYIFTQNIFIIYLLSYESLELSQKKRSVRKPSVQWGKLWGKVVRLRPEGLVRKLVFF